MYWNRRSLLKDFLFNKSTPRKKVELHKQGQFNARRKKLILIVPRLAISFSEKKKETITMIGIEVGEIIWFNLK